MRVSQYKLVFKFCPSCETIMPTDYFHRNPTRADGLAHECKRCKNAVDSARYHARKRKVQTNA